MVYIGGGSVGALHLFFELNEKLRRKGARSFLIGQFVLRGNFVFVAGHVLEAAWVAVGLR